MPSVREHDVVTIDTDNGDVPKRKERASKASRQAGRWGGEQGDGGRIASGRRVER